MHLVTDQANAHNIEGGGDAYDRVSVNVQSYLTAVLETAEDVFADRLCAVWLIGSLAYGGFGPDSDIDMVVAVDGRISAGAAEVLGASLSQSALPCPAAGLELVAYSTEELLEPNPPLAWSLNVNTGPLRQEKLSTDPRAESWHWFVLDLAIGRETSVPVTGPPMADIVGPIDRDLQVAAIRESARWHRDFEDGQPNQLANAARGLQYLQCGRWTSKPRALSWLQARGHPSTAAPSLLDDALGAESTLK